MAAVVGIENHPLESESGRWEVDPWRMAVCLFCLAYATALFSLSLFKLLSFFVMPSLFFDLLFIGFPVGAWFGARFIPADRHYFLKCLWALQGIMAASVAICLMAKRVDYLRAPPLRSRFVPSGHPSVDVRGDVPAVLRRVWPERVHGLSGGPAEPWRPDAAGVRPCAVRRGDGVSLS